MDEDVILIFTDMGVLMIEIIRLDIILLIKNKSFLCCELKTSLGEGVLFSKGSSDS